MHNRRKLLWRAFDLPALAPLLAGESLQLEAEPERGEGLFGKGLYFYESVQKALENTLVHRALSKRGLIEATQAEPREWGSVALETNFLMSGAGEGQAPVPHLAHNVFFVLFEVATGAEFLNANPLFLKELPLGSHSVKIPGKTRAASLGSSERYFHQRRALRRDVCSAERRLFGAAPLERVPRLRLRPVPAPVAPLLR